MPLPPNDVRIARLAQTFPTLLDAPGLEPWIPGELDVWAHGGGCGRGSVFAAQFVLLIWNYDHRWSCGRFNVARAVGCWDDRHRTAFARWAAKPWLA